MATAAAAIVTGNGPLTPDQVLAFLPSLVAAWLLGYGLRLNRARWSSLKEQAARLAQQQAATARRAYQQARARWVEAETRRLRQLAAREQADRRLHPLGGALCGVGEAARSG